MRQSLLHQNCGNIIHGFVQGVDEARQRHLTLPDFVAQYPGLDALALRMYHLGRLVIAPQMDDALVVLIAIFTGLIQDVLRNDGQLLGSPVVRLRGLLLQVRRHNTLLELLHFLYDLLVHLYLLFEQVLVDPQVLLQIKILLLLISHLDLQAL